jgi:D-alanyl-D-alanine carboxypeptidase (penicillin-binding protein 5/6)
MRARFDYPFGGFVMALRRTPLFLALPLICLLLGFSASFLSVASAQEASDVPQIGAQSAIVVEYPGGRILYSKNEHERMAPASLTKIMTAILALEYAGPGEIVAATPDDLVGESAMGLVSGEQQTMLDMLYGMMLPSGNDAAMAIARHLGSTVGANVQAEGADPIGRFAVMMNVRAQQLGLAESHFLNPHGLDAEGHYSTAYDLASLSWYALHIPEFNKVVAQAYYEAPGHPLLNTNEMLTRYEGADGIKTGWTDGCGLCLVTSASRGGHRLISVVLNAPQWWKDSADILDYGFAKIASDPAGASDPTLAVSHSGVVSGMLANPAAALPVPAPLAQGGGPAVTAPETQPEAAPQAGGNVLATEPMGMPSIAGSASQQGPGPLWLLVLMSLAGFGCLLIARGLGPRFRLPLPAGLLTLTRRSTREGSEEYPFEPLPVPTVRASITNAASRRREPNLLLRPEDTHLLHIERAVALAGQGKQGSSISEFLQAIRVGGPLDVGVLAEQYQLCAEAFLALARAQVAVGETSSARRTLLHGVLVLPHERVLRVALYRLPPQG